MQSLLRSFLARRVAETSAEDPLARWNDFPFGRAPWGTADTYREIFDAARAIDYPEIAKVEKDLGYAVDRAWLDELALHTQVVVKKSRINYQHGRLLYAVLRHYLDSVPAENWVNVVETGTARGFSAICMARALADAGRPGLILTLDVLPHNVAMYWNCIDDCEGAKTRHELLTPWGEYEDRIVFLQGDTMELLGRMSLNRVHFAFLDAQHTYEAVMQEAGFVLPRQRRGDAVLFDDVTPQMFPGVASAVDTLEAKDDYEMRRITASEQRGYAIGRRLV